MTATQEIARSHPVDPQDRARADFYGLLARLFYAPADAGLLALLAGSGELAAEDVRGALPEAWSALRHAAAETTDEATRSEHEAIFVGVGKPVVMLYASFYLAGFLNEKPLAELRGDLAALGFARSRAASEPEDHIAGLADVMRQLILDESRDAAERDAAQQRFYSRHIEPWYSSLCDAVEAAPQADFYRSVAAFARAFLDIEKAFFRIG